MASFEVNVCRITSKEKHPNADRLTIYHIGGYTCISNKLEDGSDRYNEGDLVVYIPSDSLLPDWLLMKMGFWDFEKHKGTLTGSKGNRVKPLKLRQVFSEGVLYPVSTIKEYDEGLDIPEGYTNKDLFIFKDTIDGVIFMPVHEGDDVSDFLEITKYEPEIPTSMSGEKFYGGDIVEHYDVEPIQKYEDILEEGEEVVFETKVHGTNCRWMFSHTQTNEETFGKNKNVFIASKGMGDKGLFFKDNEKNLNNVYCKPFREENIEEKVLNSTYYKDGYDVTVCSEIYGSGIQDLTYGMENGKFTYIVFDVYVGNKGKGRYLNYDELKAFCEECDLKMIDVLYRGPYSKEKVKEFTDGFDTIGTNPKQIREGIVIKPLNERWDMKIGRVMVKSVSEVYKLRKGGTELN